MKDPEKLCDQIVREAAARSAEAEQIAAERKLRSLQQALRDAKAANKSLHQELDLADARLDAALSIQEPFQSKPIKPRKSKANEATAVMVASDWHVGEVVDPSTVNGRNQYNPEIARASMQSYFRNCARLIEIARAGVGIQDGLLILGGDMMTGYIHEELVEGNSMSPVEEVLFLEEECEPGIRYLVEHCKLKTLTVACVYGNHGRTTPKRRVATGAKNSYEWLFYHALKKRLRDDKRVRFVISDGAHIYQKVYGHTIRITHGDDVRYGGGVGGLSIPLRKACDSWDTFRDADITVIGHWHQFVDYGYAIVNGSNIGYGPYALSVKARYEPPRQAFFLMDKEHGKTLVAPVFIR